MEQAKILIFHLVFVFSLACFFFFWELSRCFSLSRLIWIWLWDLIEVYWLQKRKRVNEEVNIDWAWKLQQKLQAIRLVSNHLPTGKAGADRHLLQRTFRLQFINQPFGTHMDQQRTTITRFSIHKNTFRNLALLFPSFIK